jgi:hypothetical protein
MNKLKGQLLTQVFSPTNSVNLLHPALLHTSNSNIQKARQLWDKHVLFVGK